LNNGENQERRAIKTQKSAHDRRFFVKHTSIGCWYVFVLTKRICYAKFIRSFLHLSATLSLEF